MQLYLVRHTQTVLPPGICYGVSDVDLAEGYHAAIDAVVSKLRLPDTPVVFSSPLKRCRLLAEKISDNVIFDDRLKELNFGTWELRPWEKINGLEAEKWMNDFVDTSCPGGESYLELSERVRSFLSDLYSLNSNKPLVVITHAGVIRVIISVIWNIPLSQSFEIQVGYGEINIFTM